METHRVPSDISDRVIFYHGITSYFDILCEFFLFISNKKGHITSHIWTNPLIFFTSYVNFFFKLYNM